LSVVKFTPDGNSVAYATYIGTKTTDNTGAIEATDIAVDATGNAYVVGTTDKNLPIVNAVQPTMGGTTTSERDAFLFKLNPTGDSLIFSTFHGGTAAIPRLPSRSTRRVMLTLSAETARARASRRRIASLMRAQPSINSSQSLAPTVRRGLTRRFSLLRSPTSQPTLKVMHTSSVPPMDFQPTSPPPARSKPLASRLNAGSAALTDI
jgi:hypothetical protein